MVPIHPNLLPILRNYLSERKTRNRHSVYFFPSARSEKALTGKDVRTVCSKLSIATAIKFTPHVLRHTFAKLSLEGGMDVFEVKEMMGHSDIATTQHYLSISTESLKQSFRRVKLL